MVVLVEDARLFEGVGGCPVGGVEVLFEPGLLVEAVVTTSIE